MKRIFRMILFSLAAIFLTALWNRGFILPSNATDLFISVIAVAIIIYIIIPLSRIVLLPLNVITLGLLSFLVFISLIHYGIMRYHFFEVKSWDFPGLNLSIITIPGFHVSYLGNLVLSSVSLSGIINLLEQLT